MDKLDRFLIGIVLVCMFVLTFVSSFSIEKNRKDEIEKLKVELSHAKRDVTAAEIDAKTLASIKSIQERLDTIEREKIEMGFSQTTLSGIISTRVYFLEQRIAELENTIASGEGNRDDSPSGE